MSAEAVSDECSAVVFYGIEPGVKAATIYYETAVEWFNYLGCPPDKIGIEGPGHSGKLGAFARGDSKLKKSGFEGIEYWELTSSTPGAKTGHDYHLTAIYSGSVSRAYASLVARSSLAILSVASMLPIARTLAETLKPSYGIGYTMPHRLGPELYAVGVNFGADVPTGEAYEEARNVSRWSNIGIGKQVWQDGLLRDVYPWNFLTRPQLTKPVGGVSLERWIQQDAGRGKISPFCDGMSFWELSESEVPQVRAALRQAGVIFDWRQYS